MQQYTDNLGTHEILHSNLSQKRVLFLKHTTLIPTNFDKYITFINNGDGGQDSIDLQQQPSISIKCN